MASEDLITLARAEFLADNKDPQLWTPATLWTYANDAEIQACIRAELIKDHATVTDGDGVPLCQLALVSGISEYMISRKIQRVVSAKISTATYPLKEKTESWLEEFEPEWRNATGEPRYWIHGRNFITVVPQPTEAHTLNMEVVRKPLNNMIEGEIIITGVSDISFDAATKKITSASTTENFIKSGIRPGCILTITDSDSNDTDLLARTVDRLSITVFDALVDEADTSAVITTTSIPEIPEEYHLGLVDWICRLAYTKQDSEAQDEVRTLRHEQRFTSVFGPMPSARALEARRTPRKSRARDKEFGFS